MVLPPTQRRCLCLSWQGIRGNAVALSDLTDQLGRSLEGLVSTVTEPFADTVVRLGVTGLSRAGKTVFLTGLVANLLDRGRMPQLKAESARRIEAAYLQPQPDDTVARFEFENHLAALTGDAPHWPESTRSVSELRLSFRVKPSGLLAGLRGQQVVHLDIVDYPGEWLLDLALLDKTYAEWADDALIRMAKRPMGAAYLAQARAEDGSLPHDEMRAQALAADFTAYLQAARAAGWSDCTPGRFLLPGDLAGSPVLTFAPIPEPASAGRGSLWREMDRRYEAYKAKVVKPFFRQHFARIDRQVVLVDVLGAIHAGPQALEDLRQTMAEILMAFRPGKNGFLSEILLGRRVEKVLFAATKADHLHQSQHAALTAITESLVREARDRAAFSGAEVAAMSLAGLRATVEDVVNDLPMVRGRLADGRVAAMYPGELPGDPARLLSPARQGAERWLDADFALMGFLPARLNLRPGEGPPHIRLDRAAEFLIGDRL